MNELLRHCFREDLPDGVPCQHLGCLSHISHPCEGCGRVGGINILKKLDALRAEIGMLANIGDTLTGKLERAEIESDETEDYYLAKLQAAYAWIIAQEKCPECFGDLDDIDCAVGNRHRFYLECCDCSKKWQSYGVEIDDDDITKWKAVQESELLDAWR